MPTREDDLRQIVAGGRARGLSDDQIRSLVKVYDKRGAVAPDTGPAAPRNLREVPEGQLARQQATGRTGEYVADTIRNIPGDVVNQLQGLYGLTSTVAGATGEFGKDVGSVVRDVVGLDPRWQAGRPNQDALKAAPGVIAQHYADYFDPDALALQVREHPVGTALDVTGLTGLARGAARQIGPAASRAPGVIASAAQSPVGQVAGGLALDAIPFGNTAKAGYDFVREALKARRAASAPPAPAPPPTPADAMGAEVMARINARLDQVLAEPIIVPPASPPAPKPPPRSTARPAGPATPPPAAPPTPPPTPPPAAAAPTTTAEELIRRAKNPDWTRDVVAAKVRLPDGTMGHPPGKLRPDESMIGLQLELNLLSRDPIGNAAAIKELHSVMRSRGYAEGTLARPPKPKKNVYADPVTEGKFAKGRAMREWAAKKAAEKKGKK